MKKILPVLLFFLVGFVCAQPRELDRVVAVVGDSVILMSEIESYVSMKMEQSGATDLLLRNMLVSQALDELIDTRVLIVHAEKDTNITISSTEVYDQVENRITMICSQNKITREQLSEALIREQGLTYNEFQKQMELQVRQELVRQKVEQFYLVPRTLSRDEVETFYTSFKDSLPPLGESVRLQKLEITLQADSTLRSQAYDSIVRIRKKIVERGKDFGEMAKEFSRDPNAQNGGDMGFISKGTLSLLPLEQAIFLLEPGEVSLPVETKIGFHIVKALERRDNTVHTLHIFIPVAPSEESAVKTGMLLDSIRLSSPSGEKFTNVVKGMTTDPASRTYGGDMGWKVISQLPTGVREKLGEEIIVGSYSSVYRLDNTFYLYRVLDYNTNRPMSIVDDYNDILRFAQQVESQKRLQDLVKSWRKDVFVKKYQ